MRPILLLRINNQIGDIFEIGCEIGKELLNVALAQLPGNHILCFLNALAAGGIETMALNDFIHVVHQVRQNIDAALDIGKWCRARLKLFQPVQQAHSGKNAVQKMACHALVAFRLEITFLLLGSPTTTVITSFRRYVGVPFHHKWKHTVDKFASNRVARLKSLCQKVQVKHFHSFLDEYVHAAFSSKASWRSHPSFSERTAASRATKPPRQRPQCIPAPTHRAGDRGERSLPTCTVAAIRSEA